MGGSLGARAVNACVDKALSELTKHFRVLHIRGNDGLNSQLQGTPGYAQFTYLNEELPDALAACDLVLSRAGANSIWEFCALGRPMLLIPLPLSASRGDQLKNAELFRRMGFAEVLEQERMDPPALTEALRGVWADREKLLAAQRAQDRRAGLKRLKEEIENAARDV